MPRFTADFSIDSLSLGELVVTTDVLELSLVQQIDETEQIGSELRMLEAEAMSGSEGGKVRRWWRDP